MRGDGEMIELALCEQKHLVLKPDTAYVFRVIVGCVECERLAEESK